MFSLKDAEEDRVCKHCGAVMIQCVRVYRVRVAASSTRLTVPRPPGPAGSAARRDSHSCTRHRQAKNRSIAICDKEAEIIGPPMTTSGQADASEDRMCKHVKAVLRHAGAVRTCAYPHRRISKPNYLPSPVHLVRPQRPRNHQVSASGNSSIFVRASDANAHNPLIGLSAAGGCHGTLGSANGAEGAACAVSWR